MVKNIEVKSKHVSPITGYFEIDNGESIYRLMEKMTTPMDQDKLAEFYEFEKKKGNPLPMNSIQHIELFNDAIKSGNKDLMNFLQKGLRMWLNTLTRVIYNPVGKEDETIHNYGTSDAFSVIGNIVGNDGMIIDIDNSNALELLLKTKDIKGLNKVSNVINSTQIHFYRINSKPVKKIECFVRFGANSYWLNLVTDRNLSDEYPAFMVGRVK